jgi:hypothetical protein
MGDSTSEGANGRRCADPERVHFSRCQGGDGSGAKSAAPSCDRIETPRDISSADLESFMMVAKGYAHEGRDLKREVMGFISGGSE